MYGYSTVTLAPGGQAGCPIALFGQYAKGFTGVIRAGAFHKADACRFPQPDGWCNSRYQYHSDGRCPAGCSSLGAVIRHSQHGNQTRTRQRMARKQSHSTPAASRMMMANKMFRRVDFFKGKTSFNQGQNSRSAACRQPRRLRWGTPAARAARPGARSVTAAL